MSRIIDKCYKIKKSSDTVPENEIRIRAIPRIGEYIAYAASLLLEKKFDTVLITASGQATKNAYKVAETLRRRIVGLHQLNNSKNISVLDEYKLKEDESKSYFLKRKLIVLEISLSLKNVFDTKAAGYQAPLPKDQVQEVDFQEILGRRGGDREISEREERKEEKQECRGDGIEEQDKIEPSNLNAIESWKDNISQVLQIQGLLSNFYNQLENCKNLEADEALKAPSNLNEIKDQKLLMSKSMEKNADEIESLKEKLETKDEELMRMKANLNFSEEDALKFTFHKLFVEFLSFYYSILNQFKKGHFNPIGETRLELYRYNRVFKHLAKNREEIIKLLVSTNEDVNIKEKNSRRIIIICSFLRSLFPKPFTDDTTLDSIRNLNIFHITEQIPECQVMIQAKNLLLDLLKNKSETSRKSLKFFEAVNLNKDQLQALTDDFMDQEINPDILKEIEQLFPRFFGVTSLSNCYGVTTTNGEIVISSSLMEEACEFSIGRVKLMFVLWHELAHKKKKLHLGDNQDDFETPIKLNQLFKRQEKDTSGRVMERSCFGEEVKIEEITKDDTQDVYEKKWPTRLEKLNQFGEKKSENDKGSDEKSAVNLFCASQKKSRDSYPVLICGNRFLDACFRSKPNLKLPRK